MVKVNKSKASVPAFAVGDQVKVSERVLPIRPAFTHCHKLQQRYISPYRVIEVVNPGAYRLRLPEDYQGVHDVFNEHDLRPWFDPGVDRKLELSDPPVQAHPALNRVVQVLDRKRYGRCPKGAHVLDNPAQYLSAR